MTWINKPKAIRSAEDDLPPHRNEIGIAWQTDDGTVWETRVRLINGGTRSEVYWSQCNEHRAALLMRLRS